jgi:asparagine synthase (glutamine-hydrolysing)
MKRGFYQMCGIAGLISFESPVGPDLISSMTRAQRHRGPDDEGYVAIDLEEEPVRVTSLCGPDTQLKCEPTVEEFTGRSRLYLGHRRLAVLDLSPRGHQPMSRDNLWIVFNGEIYNFVELRQELMALGHMFNTQTDTEVILAAYDEWGADCVCRFNGDWAFCVLDIRSRILFFSRDRFGVKPLYFIEKNGLFAFASEIKALLALSEIPRALNTEKAVEYFTLFCRDHTEETFFEGIRQLLPGENMTVDLRTGVRCKMRYYQLTTTYELGRYDHRKATAYASGVRELLTDAVRLRLRADVPVGTCLSGGLDSSAVVAIMAEIIGTGNVKQKTFTASFPGEPFDESRFAALVAKHTGVQSHMLYPTKEGYWRDVAAVLYHQDEPFGGASIYSEWEVMREASRHVKVVLDGHGGDEVFAGYKDYRLAFFANLLSERKWLTFITELWDSIILNKSKYKSFAEIKSLPIYIIRGKGKQLIYRLYYAQQIKNALKSLKGTHAVNFAAIDRKFAGNLNELLIHFMSIYTLPYLLRGEDRSCMAHSIEARVPFTDYRLVDYVFSIPAVYKIHKGWTKWLLRLAVKDLLPSEIVWRKDKLGFATPRWATKESEWKLWLDKNFSIYPASQGSEFDFTVRKLRSSLV